jgi:hypothetical protein
MNCFTGKKKEKTKNVLEESIDKYLDTSGDTK